MTNENIKKFCYSGITNLVSAGLNLFSKSLFDSNIIKKHITKFLETQNKNIPISLYVPETLGGCYGQIKNCEKNYEKYINITKDDKWIGLLIWQHKNGSDCEFDSQHKCLGCTESGIAREKEEGKKYSNSAWDISMKNGKEQIMKAKGGSYEIHNAGGKKYENNNGHNLLCKSTIIDFTIYSLQKENDHIKYELQNASSDFNYTYKSGI